MPNQDSQFQFQALPDHYEKESHEQIVDLQIDKLHIIKGTLSSQDILIVQYQNSPLLSFYDVKGRLIDVDHYLPDNYAVNDKDSSQLVINNIQGYNKSEAKNKAKFKTILNRIFKAGNADFSTGLKEQYDLNFPKDLFIEIAEIKESRYHSKDLVESLQIKYFCFQDMLEDMISRYQKSSGGYIHITENDNIIITTLNKRSGIAVIIETKNVEGELLPPNKWNIVRTASKSKLDQALVFRSEDVKSFFVSINFESIFSTDRYRLSIKPGILTLDSHLDNTDNLLNLYVYNNCYQILASDKNIIIILTNDQEITVVNTHKSVVPQKWPRKIVLPYDAKWMRVDENLSCLFIQGKDGNIEAFDITGDHPLSLGKLGLYDVGFELDQRGDLIVMLNNGKSIAKLKTNIYDLNLGSDLDSFTAIFKDISHLFKGESIFTKTDYAEIITQKKEENKSKLPTALEAARYDFETNIEHRLLESGDGYLALLEVQNKIAIARLNIAEELTAKSEQLGAILVGQRLNSAISNIVGPIEKKVNKMVDIARSKNILELVEGYKNDINQQSDTEAYREMLNNLRGFDQELSAMSHNVEDGLISDFKIIQEELNSLFASQITNDENELNRFIAGEIDQIELAILNTHEPRRLELLLSTHPACLELMSLLKQPFVLQSVAKGKRYSPAMIQTRLQGKVEKRHDALRLIEQKKEEKQNAAKLQLAEMISDSIIFFVKNHSGGFSDQELSSNANYESILKDIRSLERDYNDVRLAQDLRRKLTKRILDRNRDDLEKMVAVEGKYAYVQNDPDLYVDLESNQIKVPNWDIQITEKKGDGNSYEVSYLRSSDKEVHKISTDVNLLSGKAFELSEEEYREFSIKYNYFITSEFSYELLNAIWSVYCNETEATNYPQFTVADIERELPKSKIDAKSLRCALEKKLKEYQEKNRDRYVPQISSDFIDETPYFQSKIHEFILKAKLQKLSGSGIILLAGPPSTGKSVFLKFAASLMNREYFEHTSDKWQTKNSLVTAIKFGEYGPYSIPAGFTKAITTSHSLINIEEIKEWPEALRKSLNPFFAGSKVFTAPDGTRYDIGEDLLLCAAANLGSMYRLEDEPFTADFWSRIEVVEYDYAPESVSSDYYDALMVMKKNRLVTTQDLAREYFNYFETPTDSQEKAKFFAKQFLEFILLPKADEKIKRENLSKYIVDYFSSNSNLGKLRKNDLYSPEEAIKIAFKRVKDFRSFNVKEFYDLYNHFSNGRALRSKRLQKMKTSDITKYNQLKVQILIIRYLEGCLRELRKLFYSSAGQTEIEGTNREFIKCVHLLELMGKM
jgi:hypothetical protein